MSDNFIVPITVGGLKCEFGSIPAPGEETNAQAEKNAAATTGNMTNAENLAIVLFDILHQSMHYNARS